MVRPAGGMPLEGFWQAVGGWVEDWCRMELAVSPCMRCDFHYCQHFFSLDTSPTAQQERGLRSAAAILAEDSATPIQPEQDAETKR